MSDQIDGTRGQTPEEVRGLPSAPRPVFAAGETVPGLSSWVLERKLGGGGFGEVWLAKHALGKEPPRAVKFCLDPVARHRLITHEKNVVVRVMKYAGDHPNIVPLLDYNLDGDIPWLMYEFVEGGTLADVMKDWRELPFPKRLGRAVRVLHAVASALAACHRLTPPLVHRDLKPQNVLMAGLVPHLTDFGIGSVVTRPKHDPSTAELTAHAAQLPTGLQYHRSYLWAAPEREFGSAPDPLDDVYALGVIAYQLVIGDLSFGPGPDAMLNLRERNVPSEFVALIINSVALDPHRRPKDASAWESSLAALLKKSQKQLGPTDASVTGSRPVLLPEPDSADGTKDRQPRFGAKDFEVPTPEPTTGLPVRTAPPRRPPPLPVALELPSESPPNPRPVARPVDKPVRLEPEPKTSGKRKGLALALGGVVILGLAIAIVIAAIPPGKRAEPTGPIARVENSKDGPKGNAPDLKGGGTNGGSSEPKAKPPEVKGGTPEPKKEPDPKIATVPKEPKKEPDPKVFLPKAGEERDIEIAPGVKMTFCWIPPGTAMLGSPKGEAERSKDEVEHEYTSEGFWMGKYTVTQAEWKAVMGDNPSFFGVDGLGASKLGAISDTSRFPVESVSWDRICGEGKYVAVGFLNKLNAHGGIEKSFGKPGKFRLPSEAQWEYACRGGRGNKQPFYWGDKLNGTEANCIGNAPYGTTTKGQYLERTCAVDFTNDGKYENHPWGLLHMSGNVIQWCEDYYDKTNARRVLRGGSWASGADYCRAAYRISFAPDSGFGGAGFRLVVAGLP